MEAIWGAVGEAISPHMVFVASSAVALGLFWGAMPGLTTVMAMALLISLTYNMSTNAAIMFLIALHTASTYGGSITAVLINIPGTPASIPTAMEGYPLTKKGEGGLALGSAIVASFLGNWIGTVALIIFVPMILAIALKFGAWELFLLALWGIAISGTLTGKERPIKGWISGCLGLLIAMVGMEPMHAFYRFTFGSIALASGIRYLPILIGLFGMAEVIKALSMKVPERIAKQVGRIIPPFYMIKKYLWNTLRSGAIGTLVGAIPGAGPNISSFVAYDVAKRRAKPEEREKFGKGSYAGLIASEVANNATIGGSMLPTMTLGIPGSAGAAVFLGALNLHAVVVGPSIQIEHPGLMYFLYVSLIVANFLMYVMALFLIKPGVKLFTIRRELLMPLIAPLCAIGAYGANQFAFDLYIMIASGLLGFALFKMKFPLAPLILGVILGPMADENLRKAMMIFQADGASVIDVLSRPVGTVLLVIVILTFYDGIFRRR